jgi:hypothetical protein
MGVSSLSLSLSLSLSMLNVRLKQYLEDFVSARLEKRGNRRHYLAHVHTRSEERVGKPHSSGGEVVAKK